MKDELYQLLKEYREANQDLRPIEVFYSLYLEYYSRLQKEVKELQEGNNDTKKM